ncbi:hypothetical protein A4X06_0g1770 [Tilletia controversa]|uniref:DDE Tnp4 domain-containing protein n=1 Tax=Tilletia controversa TaxID=13291 RepID=A0A8X7MWY7_9BASI|nr:hypothetical protein A4X06_0g1770 [Tilletia controversa]
MVSSPGHSSRPWLSSASASAPSDRRYANSIAAQQCPLENLWGFIDGTVRATARPMRNQKEYYSGHKRHHGHKYQVVITPDGMMWIFGPVAARRNDSFVLQDTEGSELHQWLDEHSRDENGKDLLIFGDKGYAAHGHLVVPHKELFLTPAQDQFNLRLSRVRIAVEWAIGGVTTFFPRLDVKRAQRMLHSDLPSRCCCGTPCPASLRTKGVRPFNVQLQPWKNTLYLSSAIESQICPCS